MNRMWPTNVKELTRLNFNLAYIPTSLLCVAEDRRRWAAMTAGASAWASQVLIDWLIVQRMKPQSLTQIKWNVFCWKIFREAIGGIIMSKAIFPDASGVWSVSLGYPPYDHFWSTGDIDLDTANSNICGLVPGLYQDTIRDDRGCELIANILIDSLTIETNYSPIICYW